MSRKSSRLAHLDHFFRKPPMVESMAGIIAGLGLDGRSDGAVVALTSSRFGEGVTTVSLYLGRQIADTLLSPTVVVEANFHRPRLARYCRLPATGGLIDHLGSGVDLDECMHEFPERNLAIMPAGGTHDNPLSLVISPRFSELLDRLRRRFRVTVLDLPPSLLHAEGAAALRSADRRVLVVRANSTRQNEVAKNMDRLAEQDIKIDGVVLSRRKFLFG